MVTKNAVFMRSVAFRKRLNKYIMKEGMFPCVEHSLFRARFLVFLGHIENK